MKTKSFKVITAGLFAALASPAFAVDAPDDDAPPPPAAVQGDSTGLPVIPLVREAKPAKASAGFLGVISGELPDMLSDHLALKDGEGIVVRSVVPDGPAAKAGIVVNDVILKVAGKPVGTPEEIAKRVSSHKPGDTITLDVIHQGKPGKADVTLGIKPAELTRSEQLPLQQLDMEGMPRELAQRVRDAIAGNIGGLDLQQGQMQGRVPPDLENAIRDLQTRVQSLGGDLKLEGNGMRAEANAEGTHSESTVRMKDGTGSVEVKSKDGAKEVTILDTNDKITWSGPWNTDQDKAAAPEEVRERMSTLKIGGDGAGNGFHLKLHPKGANKD